MLLWVDCRGFICDLGVVPFGSGILHTLAAVFICACLGNATSIFGIQLIQASARKEGKSLRNESEDFQCNKY